MRVRVLAGWCAVAALGCATGRPAPQAAREAAQPRAPAAEGLTRVEVPLSPADGVALSQLKYVDLEHGFQIARPAASWAFKSGEDLSTESIAIPLIVASASQKAQVVVQVAPAVATPLQFAERLTAGLQTRAGFLTTEVVPIALAEGAVGFDFAVEGEIAGRVAILEGTEGRVFVLLATWPEDAPAAVKREVEQILASMKPTAVSRAAPPGSE